MLRYLISTYHLVSLCIKKQVLTSNNILLKFTLTIRKIYLGQNFQTKTHVMNFFKAIIQFFISLFGGGSKQKTETPPVRPTPIPPQPTPAPEPQQPVDVVTPTPVVDTNPVPETPPAPVEPAPLPQVEELAIKTIGTGKAPDYEITNGTDFVKFEGTRKGYFTYGQQTVKGFLEKHSSLLTDLNLSDSAINVIKSVSDNEGNLDAINTWDNSYLSVGMFQWSMGADGNRGELVAMMKKVLEREPDLFHHYLGQFGLEFSIKTTPVYGYFILNEKRIDTPQEKEVFRTAGWGYRFWLACQNPAVQAIQIEHAISRLKTFYYKTRSINGLYAMSDIITSEYGVALILDNHVNRPGYVAKCITQALQETGLSNPTDWTTTEERQVLDAYLRIRETFGKSPMTHADKRALNTKKYLDQGLISDERQSFTYEPMIRERGLAPLPEHMLPSGYHEQDYEEIRGYDEEFGAEEATID